MTAHFASSANTAATAGYSTSALNASHAMTAHYASSANTATTAGYATSALNAAHAQTAHYASSATEASHTTKSLIIGDKKFNGGTEVTVEIGDLGLAKAIDFLGVTISNVTDSSDINPVTLVSGTAVSATSGNVVLVKGTGEEYLWSEDKWQSLGLATSYALANHIHGNLNNNGTLTASTSSMNGAVLVVADPNVSNGIALSEVAFGSDTAKFLRNDGTWVTPSGTYSLPTASSSVKGGIKVGTALTMSEETLSVSLSSLTNSTATNVAATPAAVKAAYDLAASKTNNTGTVTSITLKAGGGISLDTDNSAITTSGTRTISHADTSSVSNLTANGRKYVTGLTFDAYGHVTAYTTGTETVTDSGNTKVTQSSTTTSDWRKILLHYTNNGTSTAAVTTVTNQVYAAVGIAAQPQTGKIRANAYNIADGVTLQYNTTTSALDFIFT